MKPLLTKAEFNGIDLPLINKDKEWDVKQVMKFFSKTGMMVQDPARHAKIIHIDEDGKETTY